MHRRLVHPALIAAALAATALGPCATLAQPADSDSSQNVPEQIRSKLTEKGYKDVKVVPGSYIVSAKDKDGAPVMMVIGPGSTSMITMTPQQKEQQQGQNQDGAQDRIIQQ